jgi:hypothetical protein
MEVKGGCYCKAVRYRATGEPMFKGQCHCRECQYLSGGMPNVIIALPAATFTYEKGSPKQFKRADLPNGVTREFCAECGTHILTRAPVVPGAVIVKVGTFDDPKQYGTPQMAIYLCDKQPFHQIPAGVATFERTPNG